MHLFDNNIMRHSLLLLFGFFTPLFAFAYLDPGTGSFIIHIIVGGLVGISYGVRVFWRQIKTVSSRIYSKINDTFRRT